MYIRVHDTVGLRLPFIGKRLVDRDNNVVFYVTNPKDIYNNIYIFIKLPYI